MKEFHTFSGTFKYNLTYFDQVDMPTYGMLHESKLFIRSNISLVEKIIQCTFRVPENWVFG